MEICFAFLDFSLIVIFREHKGVLEDLDKAQVDILHVGSNRKNAADDKLKQLMRRWKFMKKTQSWNSELFKKQKPAIAFVTHTG